MNLYSTKDHWQKYWLAPDHQPLVRHEEMLKQIVKVFDGQLVRKKFLEIGGGMGGDSIFLAKKGASVTVLDFSNQALAAVKTNAQSEKIEMETVEADARHIPFPDGTFDLVFHQGFLEHCQEPESYLQEQKRVLKKGGFLVVDVPQKYTTYTIKKHLKIKKGEWFAGWETEYSPWQLRQLVEKAGFKIIKAYGWGYYGQVAKLARLIEKMPFRLYLNWCIGVVAQKL